MMFLALLPVILGLIAGNALPAVLAGLSAAQWISIGSAALSALPAEIAAARALHEQLDHVIAGVLSEKTAFIAPSAARTWLARNGDAAIRLQGG